MAFWNNTSTAVGAGEIYVLHAASVRNISNDAGETLIMLRVDTNDCYIARAATLLQSVPLLVTGSWVLKQGDVVRFTQDGATAGDTIQAFVWGYKMNIAE